MEAASSSFTEYRVEANNPIPLIYQSGYLTIKDYDKEFGNYLLEFPNDEVKYGFINFLVPFYSSMNESDTKEERHYQVVFYLVFKLMGQFVQAEVRSARGRADAVVKTPKYIYVFEFKLNGTAEEAVQQIEDRGYLIPYQADGRELRKVGVEFSSTERNISRWLCNLLTD